jgi:hypothetical protein
MLLIIIATGMLASGCFNSSVEKGLLQGHVYIGPVSPVEGSEEEININCEVYEVRKIMIFNEKGNKLLRQVDIECDVSENYASYQIWLNPGVYTVDINGIGVDRSDSVPKKIEIIPGVTIKLDIDIDTGIR